jgi:hypothetical protein
MDFASGIARQQSPRKYAGGGVGPDMKPDGKPNIKRHHHG